MRQEDIDKLKEDYRSVCAELNAIKFNERRKFAAMAMEGLTHATAPDGTWFHDPQTVAAAAVEYADALLAELEKQNEA